MKAILIKTVKNNSKYGGYFYYAFFKDENGQSYRSCLYPSCGNFSRWQRFIGMENITLDHLNLRGKIIDADSFPVEVKNETDNKTFKN